MVDSKISLYFKKHLTYFSCLKYLNQEKYDFIFSFDSNRVISVKKYIAFTEDLINKMSYVLNFYNAAEYGQLLNDTGLVKNKNYNQNYDKECLFVFRYREDCDYFDITMHHIQKYSKIINAFEKKQKIIF